MQNSCVALLPVGFWQVHLKLVILLQIEWWSLVKLFWSNVANRVIVTNGSHFAAERQCGQLVTASQGREQSQE